MSLTPEQILEAAEKVRKACEDPPFDYVEFLRTWVPEKRAYQVQTTNTWDCGCPLYSVCCNVNCPRTVRVTYG